MSVLSVPKTSGSEDTRKPRWKPVIDDGKKSAFIVCGGCGKAAYLDHEIASDGRVTPSVACPHDGCGWHVFARLEGWEP